MSGLPVPTAGIEAFCRRWLVTEFAFFGSVVRPDFHEGSDVDVLLTFDAASQWSLFDIVDMKEELAALFGRDVDIVEERAVRNPYMLESIRRTKRVQYAA